MKLLVTVKNSFVQAHEYDEQTQTLGTYDQHKHPHRSVSVPRDFRPSEQLLMTTLMVRNIPSRFDQQILLNCLQTQGYRPICDFDFIYLPLDFNSGKCLGYAFISFVNSAKAVEFKTRLTGAALSAFSSKRLDVSFARIQGLEANAQLFSKSAAVKMIECKFQPLIVSRVIPNVLVPLAYRDEVSVQTAVEISDCPKESPGFLQTAWSLFSGCQ